jgi:hypothetical protein
VVILYAINKLTTLVGAPNIVLGDFDCRDNKQLTNLGGIGGVGGALFFR